MPSSKVGYINGLTFQMEDVDIVTVVASLEKSKKQVEKLRNKEFKEYLTYQRFNGKIEFVDGKHIYQKAI